MSEETKKDYTELEDLPDDILPCKLLSNHALYPMGTYELDSEIAKFASSVLAMKCERCGRERFDYINIHGELIGRYYRNPITYPKTHRMAMVELRLEAMARGLYVDNLDKKVASQARNLLQEWREEGIL